MRNKSSKKQPLKQVKTGVYRCGLCGKLEEMDFFGGNLREIDWKALGRRWPVYAQHAPEGEKWRWVVARAAYPTPEAAQAADERILRAIKKAGSEGVYSEILGPCNQEPYYAMYLGGRKPPPEDKSSASSKPQAPPEEEPLRLRLVDPAKLRQDLQKEIAGNPHLDEAPEGPGVLMGTDPMAMLAKLDEALGAPGPTPPKMT
jgi:hypothetical protein